MLVRASIQPSFVVLSLSHVYESCIRFGLLFFNSLVSHFDVGMSWGIAFICSLELVPDE